MEKKAAKMRYQKAKSQGKKASLVEQHRANLFTNNIANIPAQSVVVVTLKLVMPVSFNHGKFNLRLPLAITERYQPGNSQQAFQERSKSPYAQLPAPSSELSNKNLNKPPNNSIPEPFKPSSVHWPYLQSHSVAPSQSSINIALNSGIPITTITSDSHKIKYRALDSSQNAYLVTLNKTHTVSNKSFDLSWQLLTSNQPQVSSFTEKVAGEHYTLLTFFPPANNAAQVIARDIIFIIDTSGSMQGSSMQQAKASLQLALLQLNDKDSFNIIAFDDDTELLFPITQMASPPNINKAQQFIAHLSSDGGTQMYRPLSNALMMKKDEIQSIKALRQIVFITDGAVANEFELMQLLNSAQENFRLYTVGIGAAPNGYFMKKAAQFGRGSYVFIQNPRDVQQKMSNFMTKISQPALSNIQLILAGQLAEHIDVYPKKIPDLYFGEPMQIALKSQLPIASMQISGETVATPWYQQLIIDEHQSSKGISSLWARRKIESLLDSLVTGADKEKVKSQVITTSLNHQIISPYTSFIAVEKQQEDSSLLVKNKLSPIQKAKHHIANLSQAQESLMVAMPQTAIGWQLEFFIGLTFLLLAGVWVKFNDLTWLANRSLTRVSIREKHH